MARLYISGNAVDQNEIPVVGARIFVRANGELATLQDAAGGTTPNPIITIADGFFEAYSISVGTHTLEYYWGGKLRYIEALSDTDRIQAAAQAALAAVGADSYPNTAAGLAGVDFGDTFYVVSGGVGTTYRKDAGPTATQIGKFLIDPTASNAAGLIGAVGGTVQAALDARPIAAFGTRALLAAVTTPANGQTAIVSEAGAAGVFQFSTANLSAQVTIDSTRGIYVAPTAAPTGASGAWVRRTEGPWQASWFLTTPGAFTHSQIVQKIEDLRPAGQAVEFGVGTFNVGGIFVRKPGHWFGQGKNTVMNHTGGFTINTFGICTSGGTRFSNMRFTGLTTAENADARFPLYVAPRFKETDTPQAMEDFEFDHLWFDGCDTGIRAAYGDHPTAQLVWRNPVRMHIHDCVFDDVLYQPVIPEAHDIHVERCTFKLSVKPGGGYRPFSHFLRILGCDRVTVTKCRFNCPPDYPAIGVMLAGVTSYDAAQPVAYRNARNVTIDGNWFYGGYLLTTESADVLRITNNWFWNNPTRTDGLPPALFSIRSSEVPIYFGSIIIEDNWAAGYPDAFYLGDAAVNHLSFKRNTIFGNLRTGGAFEAQPFLMQVINGDLLQDGATQKPAPVLVEIEDNNLHINPSMVGAVVRGVGNMTGLHLRYSGNKVSERTVNYNHVAFGTLTGDPLVSLSRSNAFTTWSTNAVTLNTTQVGDNTSMPSGFYASMMASSKFRAEQIIGVFPPVFA